MNTLRSLPALACLVLAVLTTSCYVVRETRHGSGIEGSETRDVQAFHAISVAGRADLHVVVGGAPSVRLTIDDNLLEYVVTEVDDGRLEIRMRDGFRYHADIPLRVEVAAPMLDGVSLAGSGDVDIRGVRAAHFEVSIDGSGDMRLDGETDTLEVSIAGSGDVDSLALHSRRADVSIAGSGSVRVHASEDLDVSVAGSGDVGYSGEPNISRSIMGSGSVYAADSSDI